MRQFQYRFTVAAPAPRVTAFHRASASLPAITPPPVLVRMRSAPAMLDEGDTMEFTLWLGPLPVSWTARIHAVSAEGYTDQQVRGPFAHWEHRHHFHALDDEHTEVQDTITYRLSRNPFWGLIGLSMALSLPLLFRYRAWRTRRLLE